MQADFRFSTSGGNSSNVFISGATRSPGFGFTDWGGVHIQNPLGTLHVAMYPGLGDYVWFTLRMEVDLTGYGGDGSASLFIQNLTNGDTGFTPVPGLQNIDVDILTDGHVPGDWSERLVVQGATGGPVWGAVDNIQVIVPEPSRALLALAGLGAVAARRRRK